MMTFNSNDCMGCVHAGAMRTSRLLSAASEVQGFSNSQWAQLRANFTSGAEVWWTTIFGTTFLGLIGYTYVWQAKFGKQNTRHGWRTSSWEASFGRASFNWRARHGKQHQAEE